MLFCAKLQESFQIDVIFEDELRINRKYNQNSKFENKFSFGKIFENSF
jgi:hypothetical protein